MPGGFCHSNQLFNNHQFNRNYYYMKKIYSLFLLLGLLAFSANAWAQCEDSDPCTITISGTDSYGDGWNGASITITQNGNTIGTFAVSGSSSQQTFSCCAEQLTFSWSTGQFDGECAFTITDSVGTQLYTTTSGPGSGVFCTATPCPSCYGPATVLVTDITSDSATVSWSTNEVASGWNYMVTPYSTPMGEWTYTTDSVVVLSGLNANTKYYFHVFAACSGDSGDVSSYSFRTLCGEMALPFTEDFENNGTNMPLCWTLWEHQAVDSWGYMYYYPQIYEYSYYAHSGSHSLYFYPYYGNNSLMSPRVNIPANEVEVLLWGRTSYDIGSIFVGYTTTTDSATAVFYPVEEIMLNENYSQHIVSFANVATTDSIYVVLRATMSSSYFYLDDVTIRRAVNCPLTDNLTLVSTQSHEVTLDWIDTVGTSWELCYVPTGGDPDNSTVRVLATTKPFTLTGLSDSITYDFYVRTVCGEERGYWNSSALTIRPNVIDMPMSGTDTVYVCGASIANPGGISNQFPTGILSYLVVYPSDSTMTVGVTGTTNLSVYGYSHLYIYEGVGTSGRLLADIDGPTSDINVASSVGPLTIYLDASYYSGSYLLTTYCEPLPTCTDVYDLEVSSVTGNSAVVSWNYATVTTPSEFTILVTDTLNDMVYTFSATDTAREFVVTGLDQRVDYMVQVQTTCDNGDTSHSVSVWFQTHCLSGGDIQIGEGNNENYQIPIYSYYNSVSQQIFDSVELTQIDTIFGLKINNVGSYSMTLDMDIYIDTTDLDMYNGLTDYIPQDASKMVFSGNVSMVSGWNEIRFDSIFAYTGNKNLLVTINNRNNGSGNSLYWQSHTTTDAKTVWGYSYSYQLDPSDSNVFAGLSSYSSGVVAERSNTVFVTTCGDASCVPPSVRVTDVTAHTVSLAWVPGLYESEWSIEYKPADSTNWNEFHATTTLDTAIVSGLDAATMYDFRVSSLCGDTAASAIVHVQTNCAPLTSFPLLEDFDHFNASNYDEEMQQCWNRWDNYPYAGSYYYPYVYPYYSRSGANSMFMGASPDYFTSMLILPEVATHADTLTLSFYMMGTYTSYDDYKVQVGVMTDPTNESTFVVVDSATFSLDDYQWEYMEFDLASYAGNGHFVAIRATNDSYGFYIDDLKLGYSNPCKRVTNPVVANATTTTATLSFTDTNNSGSYTIIYGTSPDTSLAVDTIQTSATTVVLTGLSVSTQYYAWVRSNCSLVNSSSDWTPFGAFRTKCAPVIVDNDNPYEINFEFGLDSCMTQSKVVGNTAWSATTCSYNPTGAYSGGHVASLENTSRNDAAMLVLPTFDFTSLPSGAELSFWLAQVEYTYNNANSQIFLCYRTDAFTEWTVFDSITQPLNHWTEMYMQLPNSAYAPYYEVAFLGVTNRGYGTKIDDVSVHATPTCQRPTNLVVNQVTESTADLAWDGTAASYQVRYRKSGILSWSNATTNTNSITLTDLDRMAAYEFRVKAICGFGSQSNLSLPGHFTTDVCADAIINNSYDTAAPVENTAVAPLNAYYSYTYSETLVDADKLNGLNDITAFSFNAAFADNGAHFNDCQIYFGLTTDTAMTNFLYDTSFVLVYSGDLSYSAAGWRPVLLDTPFAYDGTSNLVVAVYNNSGYGAYANAGFVGHEYASNKSVSTYSYSSFTPDMASGFSSYMRPASTVAPDFQFTSCAPVCAVPVITSVSTTETAATIMWTSENGDVQLSYKAVSETEWAAPISVTGTSYTINGLNHSTEYVFRVRQDCTYDSIGYSNWTTATATTGYVCSDVTNVAATALNNSHATISWDSDESANRWEIHVAARDFDRTYEVTTNPATIDGLDQGVEYAVEVRVMCGPDYDVYGSYSSQTRFVTPTCGSVGYIQAESIGNIVHLWWVPTTNNAGYYEVQWGRSGFNANEVLGSIITPDTEAYVYNLGAHFTYGFRVRSLCGLSWASVWSSPETTVTTGDLTGIDDVDQQFRCTIYPNPASSTTTISVSGVEGRVAIEVVDMNGRTVATDTFECAADCEKRMDVSGLAQGTYFVRVATATSNSVRKLIVK